MSVGAINRGRQRLSVFFVRFVTDLSKSGCKLYHTVSSSNKCPQTQIKKRRSVQTPPFLLSKKSLKNHGHIAFICHIHVTYLWLFTLMPFRSCEMVSTQRQAIHGLHGYSDFFSASLAIGRKQRLDMIDAGRCGWVRIVPGTVERIRSQGAGIILIHLHQR